MIYLIVKAYEEVRYKPELQIKHLIYYFVCVYLCDRMLEMQNFYSPPQKKKASHSWKSRKHEKEAQKKPPLYLD